MIISPGDLGAYCDTLGALWAGLFLATGDPTESPPVPGTLLFLAAQLPSQVLAVQDYEVAHDLLDPAEQVPTGTAPAQLAAYLRPALASLNSHVRLRSAQYGLAGTPQTLDAYLTLLNAGTPGTCLVSTDFAALWSACGLGAISSGNVAP